MLGPKSVPTFKQPTDFEITKHTWDSSANVITILYKGPKDITPQEKKIMLEITNLKTPVNQFTRRGFQLTTTDKYSWVIDQSSSNEALLPPMQVLEKFKATEIRLNGDENKKNVGRISLYNSLTIFLTSKIPFQQFCYLRFKFPKELRIDETELRLIKGDGFMKPPNSRDGTMNTGDYKINGLTNSVDITGCQVVSKLTSQPNGSVTFFYLKLPD